jgi:hypothetical protein
MKQITTKYGAPTSEPEALVKWVEAWLKLSTARIRIWIRRIIHHIKEVIRLEGGNNYIESSRKFYKSQGTRPLWELDPEWVDI